jgi:hypothetical protein
MDDLDLTPCSCSSEYTVTIWQCDRWQIHRRLRELDISCTCLEDGRLQVTADTPVAIAQIWSVTTHVAASRWQIVDWLERCWQNSD